jgi:hypothetical protein
LTEGLISSLNASIIVNQFVPTGENMPIILFKLNYLDPGSSTLLIQLLAAGLLGGVGILFKVFWGRIKAFFKGEKYVPPQKDTEEDDEDAEEKDEI